MHPAPDPSPPQRIPWRLRRVHERFVGGNRIRLLRDGREAFPAMLDAITGARRQILLEMYWLGSDQIGWRFARALGEAASRGVEVAVLFDGFGSFGVDGALIRELGSAGAQVVEYNPIAPWKRRFRLNRLTRRDHRKILVVDGWVGFTGGINIADPWLPVEEGGQGWRDDMVFVQGPAVEGFVSCFSRAWQREGGRPLGGTDDVPVETPAPGGQAVQILGEAYFRNRHAISRAYILNLYRAKRRAWLANSYFIPDRTVARALERAARRGVDVRVVVAGESDVAVASWASRAMWPRLLRRGVRIFEWTRSILHSKTCVIDGHWSTIGTFNLDYLSLRSNLEVNVTVSDRAFGATLEQAFERDFEDCREVTLADLRYRSLGARFLEQLAYRFRKLL